MRNLINLNNFVVKRKPLFDCEDQRMKTNVVLLFHSCNQCNRGLSLKYNIDNGHLKITNYVYPIIMSNTMEVHVQKSLV